MSVDTCSAGSEDGPTPHWSRMNRALLTGMSGTGKSSVVRALRQRGWPAIDMDEPGWSTRDADGNQRWRADRLAAAIRADAEGRLVVSGCAEDQAAFYPHFKHVILMSAPPDVMRARIAARADNPYGKRPAEWAEIVDHLARVEPLLRRRATHEIVTTMPLGEVVDRVVSIIGPPPAG